MDSTAHRSLLLLAATTATTLLLSQPVSVTALPRTSPPSTGAVSVTALLRTSPPSTGGSYHLDTRVTAQVILGLGYEIQSDSIGSGNHGMPEANTSVPWDLVQTEKDRFFNEMLQGFRYCRLATGLYFRGLTPDNKSIVERWPGQAAGLAEMAEKSGIEGFAVEAWSPAPAWKSTGSFIDGTLVAFDSSTLSAFAASNVVDLQYLNAQNMSVVWWGLQNEPPVGPTGCTYSCCGYSSTQYYEAFKSVGTAVRAAFPDAMIHATSWSGQYYSPEVVSDPESLALVDLWTYHHVGADSDDQIENQAYFLKGAKGKPVLNNEFEYLSGPTSAARCLNTAQSIMNWLVFENAPSFMWLHALKPLTNSESSGYGLGFWNPPLDPVNSTTVPPGYWEYNSDNSNALLGFTMYMPWNSVRVNVSEVSGVNPDARILAFLFDPAMARWKQPGRKQPPITRPSRETLLDGKAEREAATKLAFVLTNRIEGTSNPYTFTLSLSGLSTSPLPVFDGHLYAPNITDMSLGSVTAQLNSTTGLPYLSLQVDPLTIQFWVQQ